MLERVDRIQMAVAEAGARSGLLLGLSRTTAAWEWSGRPELVAH
jgi:hypothetical protein